jgi:hypothetical protein
MSRAANVEERLDWRHWIERDVPDPAILPRLLQVLRVVRTFECPGVLAFPDVGITLRVDFKIEPTLFIEDVGKPWIVTPVCLYDNRIIRFLRFRKSSTASLFRRGFQFAQSCDPSVRIVGRSAENLRAQAWAHLNLCMRSSSRYRGKKVTKDYSLFTSASGCVDALRCDDVFSFE